MILHPIPGVEGKDFRTMQHFNTPVSYTKSGIHGGLDIAPPKPGQRGIVVLAAHEGYVQTLRDEKDYGNHLTITSLPYNNEKDQRRSLYGHLEKFLVKSGRYVAMGDPVAIMGGGPKMDGAGRSTNVHLHWEYAVLKDGKWLLVDVEPYIIYFFP